jgi:acrylyl-CoA reductase (NADPH)
VPGIDVAGTVEESSDDRYQKGDAVLVTGYELGAPAWGGWSEFVRVPAEWIVPLPEGLSLRQTMILGTAGFTAALCVNELVRNEARPDGGPIAVTGATGGVGVWAVRILSHLGYEVHAITGKSTMSNQLRELGAAKVLGREALQDNPDRPLGKAQFAGGVDSVGGAMLVALLKSTQVTGCVSACGLVGGDKLSMTVYPFILRGVRLAGVTSSLCPRKPREQNWQRLAGPWKAELPDKLIEEVTLTGLREAISRIEAGAVAGRIVVRIAD